MRRVISFLLMVALFAWSIPALFSAEPLVRADYSISPDYAARYPNGVIEFYDAERFVPEGNEIELKLIRMGGTEGRVSVEVKAIDISARFDRDYDIRIGRKKLVQDDEYNGTLIDHYLSESGGDYITANNMLKDEIYRQIIGYNADEPLLPDEDAAELCGASVGLLSDTLGITQDQAMEIVGLTDRKAEEQPSADAHYTSSLHELKDSILGEKTAANEMSKSDMLNMDALIGNNDENLAASAINDAAIGASLVVVFEDGENEKTVIIAAKEDSEYEPQEVFSLGLCNPTDGAELGEIINSSIVIDDNDETEKSSIGFASEMITVGSDEAAAAVDIVRDGCLNDYAEINIRTAAGTAAEDEDYLPIDKTAVFLPGEKCKTVIVPLKTSVADQTEMKTLDVVLECSTVSTDVTSGIASVHIEPKKASNKLALNAYYDPNNQPYDPSEFGEPIILGSEQVMLGETYLFSSPETDDDSLYRIGRVEIDVTKTSAKDDYGRVYLTAYDGTSHNELCTTATVDVFYTGSSATLVLNPDNIRRQSRQYDFIRGYYTEYWDKPIEYFGSNIELSINGSKQRLAFNEAKNNSFPLSIHHTTKVMGRDVYEIDEIRLYPVKKGLDYNPSKYNSTKRAAEVKGEYRVFDGVDHNSIVSKKTYSFGRITLPPYAYRGWTVSEETYTASEEAQKRKAVLWGYDVIGHRSRYPARDVTVTKRIGSTLTAEDMHTLDNVADRDVYYLDPIVRGDDMDYITVEEYNSEWGALKIGNTGYNNCDVKSSDWREGDELFLYVEPFFGYKCDKIKITRADGTVEYIKPGDSVMLTKGMKVKPELCEEDIVVNVSWEYAFIGEYESKAQNIANYSFTSDHAFTDNGDGSYTFEKMTPGDTVTMYLIPKNQSDTGITFEQAYLETLSVGDHSFMLITDSGEFTLGLTVLPSDYEGGYENEKYKISNGIPAVWKKGDSKGLTITAASNDETVTGAKMDGKILDSSSYTAEKGFVSDHTGWWLRTTREGETRLSDDMRYIACVGDAYAFTVDDHDMTFSYYLIKKDPSVGGALVTGRVVTNGGTIKRPSSIVVTSKNVDEVGVPVAGATVSVLSNDPNDQIYYEGNYYYASATTDKNGYFTVYLPGYAAGGLGYCISIGVNDRIYQNISSYQYKGTTVFQVPYQNPNFQIDKMTLGSDINTTEIALLDSNVKIGAHVVIASGYRAQRMVFRSYSQDGTLVKEWSAEPSSAAGWSYESTFKPIEYLREGGLLTVELYDQYDRGQGEFNTGYTIYSVPKTMAITLPQFDPKGSVTLPVIGDMTSVYDFGSSSKATPEKADKKSDTDIGSAGAASDKNYLEITFGASTAIKAAVKAAKKSKNYESSDAQARAFMILSNIKTGKSDSTQIGKIDGKDTKPKDGGEQPSHGSGSESGGTEESVTSNENNRLENAPKVKSGEGKSSLEFNYVLGVYMSLYSQDGKCYFEDMTLYAKLSVAASATQQFYIYGIPVYLKLSGGLDGEVLVHTDPKDGQPLETSGEYYSSSFAERMQTAGVFHITIKYTIGAGLGNPKFLSAGVSGSIVMDIDYQPWTDGAGILSFSFDAEASLLDIKIKYNIYKTSYGMFRTSGYTGTLDFSKVKNADKFQTDESGGKKKTLLSYRDANSLTEVYGMAEPIERASSITGNSPGPFTSDGEDADDNIVTSITQKGVTDTITPILMPIKDGEAVLCLLLDDDSSRSSKDFSAVTYRIMDWDGNVTEAVYLDNDNSFDSELTAAQIGDGRILVVWSDLDRSFGADDSSDIGEKLNHANLSYCIFDKNGIPGEVKKLTGGTGCDRMPTIAYDETTGKTFVVYVTTDYQTEGVSFDENHLEDLGDFLYNSYSTVCFKVLDNSGNIITEYSEPAEKAYVNYEREHGEGILEGLRYLNTQIDPAVSQATIDELTAAAADGKAYVAYSLDTDKKTTTDADRELYVVLCDLTSMAQSDPKVLTEDDSVDAQPQLVSYNNKPLLFWNNNGELACSDLADYLGGTDDTIDLYAGTYAPDVHENAATSYHVTVQPDGDLCIIWVDWEENEGKELVPAIYFREYDPDFKVKTGGGETDYTYGSWGNYQKLISVNADQDISEIAYIETNGRGMICCKIANKDDDGRILSYDYYSARFKEKNSVSLDLEFDVDYPAPGEYISFSVKAVNDGSLPSEKVTVMAELIGEEGNATPLGTQIFEEHYQSNGYVVAQFADVLFPEDPQDCKIRVTAWENDLEDCPEIAEFDLPYRAEIVLSNIELDKRDDEKYIVSLDIENRGNKEFEGKLLGGFRDETDENGDIVFTTAGDCIELKEPTKAVIHRVLLLEVSEDRYDDEGVCELDIVVIDGESRVAAEHPINLYKQSRNTAEPNDIRTGIENDELTMEEGQSVSVEAAVMPFAAQSGYHVVYGVEDTSVASVDPSGVVTAKAAGDTILTVSVVKNHSNLFINSDGQISSGGNRLIIDEHGIITNLDDAEELAPVLTKNIMLTVIDDEQPKPGKYTIIEGDGAEWSKESGKDLSFKSSADKEDFVGVIIDGETIGSDNYVEKDDGTVTLKESFLETLALGDHTLTIVSADGEATATFTVNAASHEGGTPPSVGDSATTFLWITLMAISLSVIAAVVFSGKKTFRN